MLQALFWIAVAGAGAISTPALRAHTKPTDVTYLKDVAPILQRRCAGCHDAKGGLTIALDSYERARAAAPAIRAAILERRMPPWPAAPGFGDYRNDRSLTPIEIELLTAWVEGRTPLGTIDGGAATHAAAEGTATAGAGLTIALPDAHPHRGQIERLSVELPLDRERWITEWEFTPHDAEAVIQRAVFVVDGVRLGSWVPADGPMALPRGVSVAARPHSRVAVEMQYAKSGVGSVAAGTLTVRFGSRGTAPSHLQLSCGAHVMREAVRAFAVTPIARGAGDAVEVVARFRDGRVEPMAVVPRYQPSYPLTYQFRDPRSLPRGTIVEVSSSAPGCGAGLDLISEPRAR